jgi:hypothetical protein
MSEITVIKTADDGARPLTSDEREVLFREISKKSGIPFVYFQNFADLEDRAVAWDIRSSRSDLLILTIRQLLQFPCVIPIVHPRRQGLRNNEEVRKIYGFQPAVIGKGERQASGGRGKKPARPPKKRVVRHEKSKAESEIDPSEIQVSPETEEIELSIENQLAQNSFHEKNIKIPETHPVVYQPPTTQALMYLADFLTEPVTYHVGAGENINVCGYLLDPRVALERLVVDEIPGSATLVGRLRSGFYSEQYLHTRIFAIFEACRHMYSANLVDGLPILERREQLYFVLFKGEDHAKKTSRLLLEFLWYFLNRVQEDYVSFFMTLCNRTMDPAAACETCPTTIGGGLEKPEKPGKSERSKSKGLKSKGSKSKKSRESKESKESKPSAKLPKIKKAAKTEETGEYSELFRAIVATDLYKSVDLPNIQEVVEIPENPAYHFYEKLLQGFQPWVRGAIQFGPGLANDMYSLRLAGEFDIAQYLYHSEKSKHTAALEAKLHESMERRRLRVTTASRFQSQYDVAAEAARNELVMRYYYIRRFGMPKFLQVMHGLSPKSSIDTILRRRESRLLDVISQREASVIKLERERDEEYSRQILNNSAPWVELARRLRFEQDSERRHQIFNQLNKYLPAGSNRKDWIRSKEGFPIICPHVRDMIQLEIRHKSDREIHDFLLQYAGETPLYDAYYCEICGEALTFTDNMTGIAMVEGDQPIMLYRNVEEDLREFVWKQSNQIVRSYVEFSSLKTNKFLSQFVKGLVDALYGFISLIDQKINKSKTSSLEEIHNKRKFFTIVFIWAFLIKVITENPRKIKLRFQKAFADSVNTNKLVALVLDKILESQNILLSAIPDMNDGFVRESLLAALSSINAAISKARVDEPPPVDEDSLTLLDPAFWYMATANMISRRLRAKGPPHDPTSLRSQFKVYVKSWQWAMSKAGIAEISRGATYPIPAGSTSYEKYAITSYNTFAEYMLSGIYLEPIYRATITETSEGSGYYEIVTKVDEKYQEFATKHREARDLETAYYRALAANNPICLGQLAFNRDRKFVPPIEYDDSLLALFHGYEINTGVKPAFVPEGSKVPDAPKFHQHKWDIYLYAKVDAPETAVGITITPETLTSPIDVACRICHYRMSEVQERVNAKRAVEENVLMLSFFNYYQYKCPAPSKEQVAEGDYFHRFENSNGKRTKAAEPTESTDSTDSDQKCKNCQVTKAMIVNRDEGYFRKWRSRFLEERRGTGGRSRSLALGEKFDSKVLKVEVSRDVAKWKPNTHAVSEWVNMTHELFADKWKKAEYQNIWTNLGLAEGVDYELMIRGTEKPDAQAGAKTRIGHLRVYLGELINNYYILRNHATLHKIPAGLRILINELGSPVAAKLAKLPDFPLSGYPEIIDEMKYFAITNFPEEANQRLAGFVFDLLIQSLILSMTSVKKEAGGAAALGFARYIITRLTRMETITAKMKEQKAVAIEVGRDFQSSEENVKLEAFDEDVTEEDAQSEAYSYENMDYNAENESLYT